jgi:hypothetical protein
VADIPVALKEGCTTSHTLLYFTTIACNVFGSIDHAQRKQMTSVITLLLFVLVFVLCKIKYSKSTNLVEFLERR